MGFYELEKNREKANKVLEQVLAKRDPKAIKLGTKLKDLRKLNNKSLIDIAIDWNLSKATLTNYELGIIIPNKEMIEMISSYYNITVDELMEEDSIDLNEN